MQEPNGDPADMLVGMLTHEYSEALTDPEMQAWNFNGNETGDACANYGTTVDPSQRQTPLAYAPTLGGSSSAGTLYDQSINGNHYYTQSEWSNGDLACHLQPASDSTLSASFTDTAPAQPGTAVSFNPSASTSGAGYSSVTWNWGDGSSKFTGGSAPATVTHTYSSAGTYTATLTLVDTAGNVATKSQNVVIGALPTVTTGSSSNVGTTTATIAGTVNPQGSATTYEFDYGTSTSYGSQSPGSPGSAGSGNSAVNESANLTGLQPNTTYHYRIEATNSSGTSYGSDQTFKTTGSPPTVVTGSSSNVGSSAGTIAGTVNPNGFSTTYEFDYGTSISYGSQSPASPGSAGSGTTAVNESANLTGLAAEHHLPLPDRGDQRRRDLFGSDQTFTTGSPPPDRHHGCVGQRGFDIRVDRRNRESEWCFDDVRV